MMKTMPKLGEIEPEALPASAIEEVRRHPASYAEQNLVATIDNLRFRLHQEQETIRALEEVAERHGYDKETGECLTDWFNELVVKKDTARAVSAHVELTCGECPWHENPDNCLAVRCGVYTDAADPECPTRVRERQQDQKIEQLQEAVDHWKKKYQEKIFHNE